MRIWTTVASALVIAMANGAQATTIQASVSDDRGVSSTGVLQSQNDVFLRVFGVSTVFRAVIEFDISGYAPGSSVSTATLDLRDQGSSRDGRIDVYGFAGDGTVSAADAGLLSTLVSSFTLTQANGTEDFAMDVTGFLNSLVGAGESHAGFVLVSEDESEFGVGGSDICSSEAGAGTSPFSVADCVGFGPSLELTTVDVAPVPLPASLPALLAGLGVKAGFARRRKG